MKNKKVKKSAFLRGAQQKIKKESDCLKIDMKAGFGFDPKWTPDQAIAAGVDGPNSPFFRWAGWQELQDQKIRFEKGNKESVLRALQICALNDLPMPRWLSDAYIKGYREWASYRASSLDEAFDVTIAKGKHINRLRKERKLRFVIPVSVIEMQKQGESLENIFYKIGKEHGISSSSAKNLYYKHKKRLGF